MIKFGNGLQRKYTNISDDDDTFAYAGDGGKSQKIKDMEAIRKYNEEKKLKNVDIRIQSAKEKTNHLARHHSLSEPNNPEALVADRRNCYSCGMKLHIPDAYKDLPEDVQMLLGRDSDVRHLCCFCFGSLEVEKEIIPTQLSDKEVRMLIYDPEEAVKLGLDQIKRIRRKLKSYPEAVLVGTFKHDGLYDETDMQNMFLEKFPTRYDYAGN